MRKILIFTLVATTFLYLLSPSFALAKVLSSEKGTVGVSKDEVVNDDLFIGGQNVEIAGTVNGDVYAGGETIRVSGTINGDLHVGAGTAYLSGEIRDDVYVGAGNVSVSSAKIGDSLLIGAGNVNIDKDSSIGGSLLAGSGNISIYAPVARNVMLGAGTVDLNSTVGGEVRIGAGDISVGPDTKVTKDFYYMIDEKENDIKISQGASVSGMVKRVENKLATTQEMEMAKRDFSKGLKTVDIFAKVISLIGALVVGFLWLRLFPRSFTKPSDLLTESFLKSLGIGFVLVIVAFPALILLALTVIGLPLAGVLLLILLLTFYLTKLVVGMSFGKWLSEKFGWKKMSDFACLTLGLVAIYILKVIPVVGFFASLVIFCAGFGVLTLYYKSLVSSK